MFNSRALFCKTQIVSRHIVIATCRAELKRDMYLCLTHYFQFDGIMQQEKKMVQLISMLSLVQAQYHCNKVDKY